MESESWGGFFAIYYAASIITGRVLHFYSFDGTGDGILRVF